MAYTYLSSVNSTGNSAIQFRMGYEVVSQDIVGGVPQSVVNVVLQTRRTNTSTTNKDNASTTVSIDSVSSTVKIDYNVSGYTQGTWYTIRTLSNNVINHNTTGEKTLPLSFSINLSGTSASSASGSWSVNLPTIPTASKVSLNAASYTISSTNPVATATITINNLAYYHKITWSIGSYSTSTNLGKYTSSPKTTTQTLTAANWLPQMTSSATGTGTCTLQTFSDSSYQTQVGLDSVVTFTVVCAKTPTIGSVSTALAGSYVSSTYVGGFSKCKVTASTVAGVNSSTIAKYEFLQNGIVMATYNSSAATYNWTSGTLAAGTYTFAVRVTDSRGLTATKTATAITVATYATPKITNVSVFRCDSTGAADNEGTWISVKATSTATPNANSISSFKVYTKQTTESSYTDKGTLQQNTATKYSGYDNTKSYNVKITAVDALGQSVDYLATVNTASYTMDFKVGGLGIGIGKVAEEDNLLDSAWVIRSATNIEADGYFRGKSGGQSVGKIILPPRYNYTDLGVSSGINLAFFTAWMKRIISEYSSVGALTHPVFITAATPASSGTIIWEVYSTATSAITDGLPASSAGIYIPYGNSTTKLYRFGTASATAWFSSQDLVDSGEQAFAGKKLIVNESGIYHTSGNPMVYFLRSAATTATERLGSIFTTVQTVNSKNVAGRMYFRTYSYDSTTGDGNGFWEQYRLPTVTANRTSSPNYEILTSKSPVTIAQGGTGQGAPSTVTTGVVSSVSGATLSVQNARKWGKCCDLYLEFNAGTVAGNGNITATVASGYIPALAASGCGYWSQSPFIAQLDSSGNLSIRNASGTSRTFSTTSPLRIALSYQIA